MPWIKLRYFGQVACEQKQIGIIASAVVSSGKQK